MRRGAGKAQHDPAGFCAGRDAEVVFELSLTAVVDEIDAGVNATVFYTAILGNVVTPFRRIIADVITALSRERLRGGNPRGGIGSIEPHTNDAARGKLPFGGGSAKIEHGFVGG